MPIGSAAPMNPVMRFDVPVVTPPRYRIVGVTKDSSGTPLASCIVAVFETASGLLRGTTTSDSSGNYSLDVTGGMGLTFFVVAYKAGSPDIAGTTVNTLVGI